MEEKVKAIGFRPAKDLRKLAEQVAANEGIALSSMMRNALIEWMRKRNYLYSPAKKPAVAKKPAERRKKGFAT